MPLAEMESNSCENGLATEFHLLYNSLRIKHTGFRQSAEFGTVPDMYGKYNLVRENVPGVFDTSCYF